MCSVHAYEISSMAYNSSQLTGGIRSDVRLVDSGHFDKMSAHSVGRRLVLKNVRRKHSRFAGRCDFHASGCEARAVQRNRPFCCARFRMEVSRAIACIKCPSNLNVSHVINIPAMQAKCMECYACGRKFVQILRCNASDTTYTYTHAHMHANTRRVRDSYCRHTCQWPPIVVISARVVFGHNMVYT